MFHAPTILPGTSLIGRLLFSALGPEACSWNEVSVTDDLGRDFFQAGFSEANHACHCGVEENVRVLRNKNSMWRRVLRAALVASRVIKRPALVMTVQDRHPALHELQAGQLIVVISDGRPKWAYFQCPGNCGSHVQLSLDLLHPPRWTVKADFLARPSISPSVHRESPCDAHFVIQDGRIDWLSGHTDHQCMPSATTQKDEPGILVRRA